MACLYHHIPPIQYIYGDGMVYDYDIVLPTITLDVTGANRNRK